MGFIETSLTPGVDDASGVAVADLAPFAARRGS